MYTTPCVSVCFDMRRATFHNSFFLDLFHHMQYILWFQRHYIWWYYISYFWWFHFSQYTLFLQEPGVLELRPDLIFSVVSSGRNVFIQSSPSWIYQGRLIPVSNYHFLLLTKKYSIFKCYHTENRVSLFIFALFLNIPRLFNASTSLAKLQIYEAN